MATLNSPSPANAVVDITLRELAEKQRLTAQRMFSTYSFASCCGSRVINADWSWKGYERFSAGGGWNVFEGVTDESKISPETKRILMDIARYKDGMDWKKVYVMKDTTFMLVVIGHTSAEVIEKMYSADFLKKHRVGGFDINDPDDGLVALVWAEERT